MMITSNVLDPVHATLDPSVFDAPDSPTPTLKPRHRKWIRNSIIHVLTEAGYDNVSSWLRLVLTGSLTTYQYSDHSDVDVSLFVDTAVFPEWSRADMISVMVNGLDGKHLPGTPHPMQNFVVPQGITPEMLYAPGVRSGYDLQTDQWIVPPERTRAHDVQHEMNAAYRYALMVADKMQMLLQYDHASAVAYWHMVHKARQRDMRAGKGDYALTNIVYKFLDKKGLLPEIAQVSGEYIAKNAGIQNFDIDPSAIEQARDHLGLEAPVNVRLIPKPYHQNGEYYSGGYKGMQDGAHEIDVISWLRPETASQLLWHEMTHAKQFEQDPEAWKLGMPDYLKQQAQGYDAYKAHPWELEANQVAENAPFSLVANPDQGSNDGIITTNAGLLPPAIWGEVR